jgi:hypothetical protein
MFPHWRLCGKHCAQFFISAEFKQKSEPDGLGVLTASELVEERSSQVHRIRS